MSANNKELAKCSIGVLNGDKCHKDNFTQRPSLLNGNSRRVQTNQVEKWILWL